MLKTPLFKKKINFRFFKYFFKIIIKIYKICFLKFLEDFTLDRKTKIYAISFQKFPEDFAL